MSTVDQSDIDGGTPSSDDESNPSPAGGNEPDADAGDAKGGIEGEEPAPQGAGFGTRPGGGGGSE